MVNLRIGQCSTWIPAMFLRSPPRYAMLGIPVDNIDLGQILVHIDNAAKDRRPVLISTINTNFLTQSQRNRGFRDSLYQSDLCTVDGVGVMLVGKLITGGALRRLTGADLLQRVLSRARTDLGRPLRVFFLGGQEGVAATARHRVNMTRSMGVCCVGALNPGFGTMDDLSRDEIIGAINDANPDFVVLSLGAERGQAWLMRNRHRLRAPVTAHLGAAVNFVAGSIHRAPDIFQKLGLEWLWRILEEPVLLDRYARDAVTLASLLALHVLPLALMRGWDRLWLRMLPSPLTAELSSEGPDVVLRLSGAAVASEADRLSEAVDGALAAGRSITVDLSATTSIDARGIGELMRLGRELDRRGLSLRLQGIPARVSRYLDLNRLGWLK